jgi:hypothetical protein
MHVQRNNEARLCNHCCRGKATMHFLCIEIDLNVAVNNTELLSGDMDM